MRPHLLLMILAAILWSAPFSLAESAPAPTPVDGPAATEQTPAAPTGNGGQQTPAPAARKPEEEQAGILDRIKAYASNKNALASKISGLESQVATLTSERDKAIAERDALKADADKMRADLTAFGDWLAEHGTSLEKAKEEPAKAFEAAVGAGVATVARQIGVPVGKVPVQAGGSTTSEKIETLKAELAAERDPKRKGELVAEIQKLRNPKPSSN